MEAENGTATPFVDPANSSSKAHDPGSEAKNKIDDLVALSRVSAAISGLRELEAILRVGLNSVLDIMDGVAGGIMLLDEQTETLSYCVYHNLSATYAKEMYLRLGEGIAGKVAQSGRSIVLDDISLDPSAARPDLIRTEGLKAFLSVPLRAKGNVLGVMNVASHVPHRFTKRDMHLLHSIGDLLGIAIEQAKLYEQLTKSKERYRQLARQILLTQEEERRRIARELHDETSQTLSGLALNLRVLMEMAEMIGIQDIGFKTRLERTHSLAVQVGTEVSRLIANLRPTLLDTLGLIPAIHQCAETNLTPLGIDVSFEFEEVGESLPPEVEAGLFRWAQGAIGNIMQHSRARNATISLKREGDELVLCISDNGRGFDVTQLIEIEESGRGAGLFSMKERISLLGGACSVQSEPGQGTTVTARVPVTWSTADAEDKGIGS
jgi:two-component system NarL family sensor kinase